MIMFHDKTEVILSTISMTVVCALAIYLIPSTSLSAWAQGQETFFESDIRTANETGTMVNETAAAPQAAAPEAEQGTEAGDAPILWQGQVSSNASELPGREDTQSAVIIGPREDDAVYSGILTYQASRPVALIVWNNVELSNTTDIPEAFGDMDDIVTFDGKSIALAEIGSGTSASVPFAGNALELVGEEEEPFIVTYSLNAIPAIASQVSDIQSLMRFNATEAEQTEAEEEGEQDLNEESVQE
jgi:hypothetical protein